MVPRKIIRGGRIAIGMVGCFPMALLPAVSLAQSVPPSLGEPVTAAPASPILTVDQDRLFRESAYGLQVERELERLTGELAAENRRIEAELTEEERQLTAQRPTLSPQEFTERADAFDARVEEIRKRQDGKGRDLARRREAARAEFLRNVLPVLSNIMRERGAVAILNAQAIFLSFDTIDITDRAIERVDARIGSTPFPPAAPNDPGARPDVSQPREGDGVEPAGRAPSPSR